MVTEESENFRSTSSFKFLSSCSNLQRAPKVIIFDSFKIREFINIDYLVINTKILSSVVRSQQDIYLEMTEIDWDIHRNPLPHMYNGSFSFKMGYKVNDVVKFQWTKSPNIWFNGKKYRNNKNASIETKVIPIDEIENEKDLIIESINSDPLPEIHNHIVFDSDEIIFWLASESVLLKTLMQSEWLNLQYIRYGFRNTYEPNKFLSKSTYAIIIGKQDILERYCNEFNEKRYTTDIRKVTDKANELVIANLELLQNNNTKDIIEYFQKLIPSKSSVRENIYWSSFLFKKRNEITEEFRFETIEEICIKNNINLPIWLYNNEYSFIIPTVYYADDTEFSFPGGKRLLGETAYQSIIRETYDEIGIDLKNANFELLTEHNNTCIGSTNEHIHTTFIFCLK